MSAITDGFPGGTRRSFIATQVFNDFFYSYNNGQWGNNPGTSEQCPAGRILRENGRKLYPKANPNVDQFYVGVYDSVTFLSGFIDPNDAVFALFNDNKPTYVDDSSVDEAVRSLTGKTVPDAGAPVFTNGNVIVNEINADGVEYGNKISLENADLSGGNAVYFQFQGSNGPFVECYSKGGNHGEQPYPNSSTAWMWTYPGNAELYLQTYDGTSHVDLYSGSNGSSEVNLVSENTTGYGQIVVRQESWEGYVGLYANTDPGSGDPWGNGDIYYTGLLHAVGSSGKITLASGIVTVTNPLFAKPGTSVHLTRATPAGTLGHLWYLISGSNMTVHSSSGNEASVINYLITSTAD